ARRHDPSGFQHSSLAEKSNFLACRPPAKHQSVFRRRYSLSHYLSIHSAPQLCFIATFLVHSLRGFAAVDRPQERANRLRKGRSMKAGRYLGSREMRPLFIHWKERAFDSSALDYKQVHAEVRTGAMAAMRSGTNRD